MELLAPAGTTETFFAALQGGADAVYIGAPGINARNLSRDLSMAEIGAMIDYAHGRHKKVYIAANSLLLQDDLEKLGETLFLLNSLQADAIIVQDLALIRLIGRYFPDLPIHVSTLAGCSNRDGAAVFSTMGCSRVVLARELTLEEITAIATTAACELEVFVHGAMCYSVSGLCLFSSFHGGKSGLRGRCVQPCRRAYSSGSKGGKGGKGARAGAPGGGKGGKYLFSMNDLEGFTALAGLKEAGVASVKIEGRLRSANYVGKIVEAYRTVIDAGAEQLEGAIETARLLAEEAMGRRTSSGYFFSPQPTDAIAAHHSGNMGLHLGRFSRIEKGDRETVGIITPRYRLSRGDRLRIHIESSGERSAFTLHSLHSVLAGTENQEQVDAGVEAAIVLPSDTPGLDRGSVELYKIDSKGGGSGRGLGDAVEQAGRRIKRVLKEEKSTLQALTASLARPPAAGGKSPSAPKRKKNGRKQQENPRNMQLWLRTDSAKMVTGRLPFVPDALVLNLDRNMLSQAAVIKRSLGKRSSRLIWALPPVLFERDLHRWKKHIRQLIRAGFTRFQIGHISQKLLFYGERVRLYGDYTLNLGNSHAVAQVQDAGLTAAQVAPELDRSAFQALLQAHLAAGRGRKMELGLTVFGAPPLFTSRLVSKHLPLDRPVNSPKGESFMVRKKGGLALTVPTKPFSLLPYLDELSALGFSYGIVDTTLQRGSKKDMDELGKRVSGEGKVGKLPPFNYLGRLE